MSWPWSSSTRKVRVTSAIPSSISAQAVLAAYHDNDRIIHLNPLVTDVALIPLDDDPFLAAEITSGTDAATYRISDKIPWYGTISYTASIVATPDGTDSVVNAPMGLKMWSKTRVVKSAEEENAQWVLREETEFRGIWLLMPFVVWNFESSHKEVHEKLFKQIEESGGTQG